MDQHRIKELIDLIEASDLTDLSLSEGGATLHLSRHASPAVASIAVASTAQTPRQSTSTPAPQNQPAAPAPQPAPKAQAGKDVHSPLYGVLHLTPSPDEAAFVQVGDSVSAGQTLCIVEAMKMFHQVDAPVSGTIEAVLAQAGSEVERGQPLFRISQAG